MAKLKVYCVIVVLLLPAVVMQSACSNDSGSKPKEKVEVEPVKGARAQLNVERAERQEH